MTPSARQSPPGGRRSRRLSAAIRRRSDSGGTCMATVELSFTALPAHVRTARLVATAVARRRGVDESLLDEVRLAVGEACSRAVEGHQLYCPAEPVRLALTDLAGRFEVEVTDTCAPDGLASGNTGGFATAEGGPDESGRAGLP